MSSMNWKHATVSVRCQGSSVLKPTHRGPGLSGDENVVSQQTEQEWDVGLEDGGEDHHYCCPPCCREQEQYLDTTNTELDEGTKHLSASHFVGRSANRDLDEQAVVVRLGEARISQLLD